MVTHPHPAASCRPTLTEAALCAWVGQAYPGEQLVYHRGFLAIDAAPEGKLLTSAARHQLRQVADRAYQLFEQGLVHLVQHREAEGSYRYILVARRRPQRMITAGALGEILERAGLCPATPMRRSA